VGVGSGGGGGSAAGGVATGLGLGRGVGRGLTLIIGAGAAMVVVVVRGAIVVVVVVVVGIVVVVDVAPADGIELGLAALTARGLMSRAAPPGLADGEAAPSGESIWSRPRGPCIIMRTSAVSRAAAITLAAQATITLFLRSRKRRRECDVVWLP
jgi:hypothetical protein